MGIHRETWNYTKCNNKYYYCCNNWSIIKALFKPSIQRFKLIIHFKHNFKKFFWYQQITYYFSVVFPWYPLHHGCTIDHPSYHTLFFQVRVYVELLSIDLRKKGTLKARQRLKTWLYFYTKWTYLDNGEGLECLRQVIHSVNIINQIQSFPTAFQIHEKSCITIIYY